MNDALMCTVKLENPGVTYEKDGTGQEYYGKATLCDASGKQVLEVENTRLNSQGSQIALTTRFQTMEFANLYIAYQTQIAEGGRVDTALTKTDAQIDYTPDTRLLNTLSMGGTPDQPQGTDTADTNAENESTPVQDEPKKGCKSVTFAPVAFALVTLCAVICKKKKDE